MDAQQKVTVEQLRALLGDDFDRLLERVAASVSAAAPGRLLADSEELSRDAIHEFGQAAFQAAVQQRVDAAEAAFPPSTGLSDRETMQKSRSPGVQGDDDQR